MLELSSTADSADSMARGIASDKGEKLICDGTDSRRGKVTVDQQKLVRTY